MLENLTGYEEIGLNHRFNLGDGHARQSQLSIHEQVLQELPAIFHSAQAGTQRALEDRFKATFFRAAGQASVQSGAHTQLSYSASVSTEILANYLKAKGHRVGLLHPTFDNLAMILRRVGVPLVPLEEAALSADENCDWLNNPGIDAFFLVCPNNPTGWCPTQRYFEAMVRRCGDLGKLLIVDFCFRFFDPQMRWDQYASMTAANIDFVTIEDTGKTWPTLDLKVGMITTSPNLAADFRRIHSDVLLNISPFTLELLRRYIDSGNGSSLDAIASVVETNRRVLRQALAGTLLRPATDSVLGVEWLAIDGPMTGKQLWAYLQEYHVYVLPGEHFFWAAPGAGQRFIRIALMRPLDLFDAAVSVLAKAMHQLERQS